MPTLSTWTQVLGVVTAFAVVSAGADDAAADRKRTKRDQKLEIKVELDERTRPVKARTDVDTGPTASADDILDIEKKKAPVRQEQIDALIELVGLTPADKVDEKADLYFRIAELYRQQNRNRRLESTRLAIAADGAKKKADRTQLAADAKDMAEQAAESLKNAIKAYKLLSGDDYRNFAEMDKALFRFGYTLQSGGWMKEARTVYQRLLKDHPSSKYVPDAKMAFGDYWFEQADLDPDNRVEHLENAAAEYAAVMKFPKATIYAFAVYKHGWVDYNLANHGDALAAFYKVVELTRGDGEREGLNRAAKKDLVRAFAEVGNVEKAHLYFKKVDKTYAFEMMRILGDVYLEQGKVEKAVYAFRELIGLDGKHRDVCVWQYNVAHAMLTAGNNTQRVDEIEKLVELYGALAGKKKAIPADALEACHDDAAAMSGDLARAYHSEWTKTQDPTTLAHADRLYHVYLDTFPKADDHAETAYYHAELRWTRAATETTARLQSERWDEAAGSFDAVVREAKVNPTMLEEAAWAAVLARDNAMAVDPRVTTLERTDDADDKVTPREIGKREQQLIDAAAAYLKAVKKPRKDAVIELKFLQASIYRRHDQLELALPVLTELVEKHRDHERGATAVDVLLHTLNRLGRHDEMIAWVAVVLADQAFLKDHDEIAERLGELQRVAERKGAEKCEAEAKASKDDARYIACGEMYVEIFNRDTGAGDADEVLYNAAVNFEQARSLGAAIELYQTLVKEFPDSEHAARSLTRLGDAYARIAWYDQAAATLEKFATEYAGEPLAAKAIEDAVFYRKGSGDDKKAIADTTYFIKAFGKKKGAAAADAFFSLTTVYEKQGDKDVVVKHLRRYLDRYGKKGGVDRQVVAYAKIGQLLWEQACAVATKDGSCVRVVRERALRVRGKKVRKSSQVQRQCGPDYKLKTTVVGRDEKKVKAAMQAFATAIAIYDKAGGKTGGDDRLAKYYYAQAHFGRADRNYEEFLALRFPAGLDFSESNPGKARKSMKRFETWMADKLAGAKVAQKGYDHLIFEIGEPSHAIAAAARHGQLLQNFSDALFTAEIPRELREASNSDELVEVYCDTLTDMAQPLEDKSIVAFEACLSESTKRGWFSDWSRLCERELGQIRPEDYPTASELRASAGAVAPITALEPRAKL